VPVSHRIIESCSRARQVRGNWAAFTGVFTVFTGVHTASAFALCDAPRREGPARKKGAGARRTCHGQVTVSTQQEREQRGCRLSAPFR